MCTRARKTFLAFHSRAQEQCVTHARRRLPQLAVLVHSLGARMWKAEARDAYFQSFELQCWNCNHGSEVFAATRGQNRFCGKTTSKKIGLRAVSRQPSASG